jgi:hypothetical protein
MVFEICFKILYKLVTFVKSGLEVKSQIKT